MNPSGFGGLRISKTRCSTEFCDATASNPQSEKEVRKKEVLPMVLLARVNLHSNSAGMRQNEVVGPEGFEPPTKRL